jgi:replicative DNA helicase
MRVELMRIETKILSNLVYNEDFCRKVAPFINPDYFQDRAEKILAQEILQFFGEYNKPPTKEVLLIESNQRTDISQEELKYLNESINTLSDEPTNYEWLIEHSEKFCKDRAVYNAIMSAIKIIDGRDKNNAQDSIPNILSDALGVSFDKNVGHDYLDDAESRFEFYHKKEDKVSFDLDLMNKITAGGLSRKSLNVCLAGTGAGKTLFMCHLASSTLMQGKNVLYITMEMAEERIAERVDANLMNLDMDELKVIDRKTFDNRLNKIAMKTRGKFIVKEYPTAGAHSGNFRALLEELKVKREFVPDLLIIDYLNICASSRLKMGASVNSYTYIKSIAEELRGLAVEYNVPIMTATQVTRGGYNSSDVELTDTSESFGLPATADLMFALIRTEELDELNQVMIKQLKNRYNDPSYYKRFVLGIDRPKMKLYDAEPSAQKGLSDTGQNDDKPVFDKSKFGERSNSDGFSGFKF